MSKWYKMVFDTPPSQDESTHPIAIWDSYLKKYRRYAPDTIFLETRSEVNVTVTKNGYTTYIHPKMHQYTKYAPDTIILETRSEAKVKVTQKLVHDTLSSQNATTRQIWDSYLK